MKIECTPEEFKELIGKLPVPQEKSTWVSKAKVSLSGNQLNENKKIVQLLEQLNENMKHISNSLSCIHQIQLVLAVLQVAPTSQLSQDLTAALLQGAKELYESLD